MARALATTVLLVLALSPAVLALDTTVATLGPQQGLVVGLKYIINGVESDPAPVNYTGPGLPVLQSAENPKLSDTVIISYAINGSNPNATNDANTGIALRACFAKSSAKDRPWRNDKKVINPSESNQCKKLITKTPLPLGNGTFVWKLPNNLPAAIYNIRAYTVCGTVDDKPKYCSWGQSPGYYQTNIWDTVPSWLLGVTVPLICLGPTLLVMYGGAHFVHKKMGRSA
jgi:hypothetical protein